MPDTVTVSQRIRPLRMLFLIRPTNIRDLQKVLEYCTCAWGGMYNGIVPIYTRAPKWWSEPHFKAPSPSSFASQYIQVFEPDYIVCDKKDQGVIAEFPKERTLELAELFDQSPKDEFSGDLNVGLNVLGLYRQFFQEECKYLRAKPLDIATPSVTANEIALFNAVCFGAFPGSGKLQCYHDLFQKLFNPNTDQLTADNYIEKLSGLNPISLGRYGFKCVRWSESDGPTIFIMDATDPVDLIDFWNLRAIGWNVFPAPIRGVGDLITACNSYINRPHSSSVLGEPISVHVTIIKSKHVAETDYQRFANRLDGATSGRLRRGAYPRFWDSFGRKVDSLQRCVITAEHIENTVPCQQGRISFQIGTPSCAPPYRLAHHPGWASIIHVQGTQAGQEVAEVIPSELGDLSEMLTDFKDRNLFAGNEGIVLLSSSGPQFWNLPTRFSVISRTFDKSGRSTRLSGAGKIAAQVIRQLGGPGGSNLIRNADLMRKLNELAKGQVESGSMAESQAEKPTLRRRSLSFRELRGLVMRISDNDKLRADYHLQALLRSNILKLGVELSCPNCTQRNWYPLGKFGNNATAFGVLHNFHFPSAIHPKRPGIIVRRGPLALKTLHKAVIRWRTHYECSLPETIDRQHGYLVLFSQWHLEMKSN